MTGFTRRPLAILVCCLFSCVSRLHAAQGDDALRPASAVGESQAVPDESPLRLRGERRFNVMGPKKPSLLPEVGVQYPAELVPGVPYPLFVIADRLEGRTEVVAQGAGEVELRRVGAQFYGEQMTYWPLDDEVEMTGSVRMLQEGQEFNTPHLRLQLSEQVGFAEQADFYMVREVTSKFYRPPRECPCSTA